MIREALIFFLFQTKSFFKDKILSYFMKFAVITDKVTVLKLFMNQIQKYSQRTIILNIENHVRHTLTYTLFWLSNLWGNIMCRE